MTVCDLKVGQKGIIDNISGNEKLVKRLLALGCISDLALRKSDAKNISLK